MISTELAANLRDAGLVWRPTSGDRFQLDEPEFDADIFTVSEMTIEPREYATGAILSFNGTTEWALDSISQGDALWLPREDQLRELLRGAFRLLERAGDTHRVAIEFAGEAHTFEHPQPEDAYALALLHILRRIA